MSQNTGNVGEKGRSTPEKTRHCLPLKNIKNIEIVDNQTILFHTYQKAVWKNTLPEPCPGLKIEGGISYHTSINALCDLDIITVLNLESPCRLSKFEKVKSITGNEH